MHTRGVILVLLALLAGCRQSGVVNKGVDSRFFLPPVGSKVLVKQDIPVPPGWARTFFQRGEAVGYYQVDWYSVNCNFEINQVSEQIRYIQPGEFLVSRVEQQIEGVVHRPGQPVRLAAAGRFAVSGVDAGGVLLNQAVHLWLESEEQPEVRRLSCRGTLDDAPNAQFPSIAEMRQALGSVAEIRLPEDAY